MQYGQTEESSHHDPVHYSRPAPPASCADDTYSKPRTIQGLTSDRLLVHVSTLDGVPAVSLEQAPRGEDAAEPTLSLGHSYTHLLHSRVSNESEPFPAPTRRGSFTASERCDAWTPGFSQHWSTYATLPDPSFDSDSTAASSFVNIGSQYSEQKTPGNVTPRSDTCDHGCDIVQGAHHENSPEYAQSLNLSPISTRSTGTARDAEQRLYTSSLSLPAVERGLSGASTVVSDAGREEQIRENYVLDSSRYSSSIEGHEELQDRIWDSLKRSKKYQGRQNEFLPAKELQRLVNPKTVAVELNKALGETHDEEEIQRCTLDICSKTEVERKNGKSKTRLFVQIFALLVILDATSSIRLFIKENVSDIDLPLVWSDTDMKGLCRSNTAGESVGEPLKCFAKWSRVKLRNFFDYQWKLLAPFFSKGSGHGEIKHYLLREEHILPFLDCADVPNEEGDKAGGYGKVSMVMIHPDHHNFEDDALSSRGFAVKQQLYESDTAIFRTEIDVLKKFSGGRGHPHIVSLLATFEQFKKLHLIFHRAQGDLLALWSDSPEAPLCNYNNTKWLAEQCKGLADGLLRLHKHLTFTLYQSDKADPPSLVPIDLLNPQQSSADSGKYVRFDHKQSNNTSISETTMDAPFDPKVKKNDRRDSSNFSDGKYVKQYGRHGDINPGNILWYDSSGGASAALRGTLKLADFGQAELNSLKSRTRPRNVANTVTYRPPESDRGLNRTRPLIRQTYDMWCLGCVYLELLTWFLGGDRYLQQFVKLRLAPDYFENNMSTDNFFQVTRKPEDNTYEVVVKEKVIQFIDGLHKHQSCTDYCHDLLNVIQHDMLVVDSNGRKSCEEVWKGLNQMCRRCCMDEDYATIKTPWCFKRSSVSRPVAFQLMEEPVQAAPTSSKIPRYVKCGSVVQEEQKDQSEAKAHAPRQHPSSKSRRRARGKSSAAPDITSLGSLPRR